MSVWRAVLAGAGEKRAADTVAGGRQRVAGDMAVEAMQLEPMAAAASAAGAAEGPTSAVAVAMVAAATWPAPMAEEPRRAHPVARAWRSAATVVADRSAAATRSADTLAVDPLVAASAAVDTSSVSRIRVPAPSAEEIPAALTWVALAAERSGAIRARGQSCCIRAAASVAAEPSPDRLLFQAVRLQPAISAGRLVETFPLSARECAGEGRISSI